MALPIEIVRASAGSGKTYRLAVKYISTALQHKDAFRSILAVTFTNKATKEMKQRIVEQLHELANHPSADPPTPFMQEIAQEGEYTLGEIPNRAKETLAAILSNYSAFAVSTIDRFSQRIIRSFFSELGLDLGYQVIIDTASAVAEAIDRLIEKSSENPKIERSIERLVGEFMQEGRGVNIRDGLEKLYAKYNQDCTTKELDFDTIMDGFDALQQRYYNEQREFREECEKVCRRIVDSGYTYEQFRKGHGSFAVFLEGIASGGSFDDFPKYVLNFASAEESKLKSWGEVTDTGLLVELVGMVGGVLELYRLGSEFRVSFELLRANFYRYTLLYYLQEDVSGLLGELGCLALGDSASLLQRITCGSGVSFIFERLGEQYSTIYIDEFQDTSVEQWEAFAPLIEGLVSVSEQSSVMLIGDIKQAIYRFRGGDWRLLGGGIQSDFGGMYSEFSLTTSWRSEPQIVGFNNRVIEGVVGSVSDLLGDFVCGSGDDGVRGLAVSLEVAYGGARQDVSPQKKNLDAGYVEVCRRDLDDTLVWMCDRILEIREQGGGQGGGEGLEVAVLVRRNSEARMVAQRFMERGIGFLADDALVLGGSGAVRFVVNCLRYSVQGGGSRSVVLGAINDYLGRAVEGELGEREQEIIAGVRTMDLSVAVDTLIREFRLSENPEDMLYLQALQDKVYEFMCGENAYGGVGLFLEEWDGGYCNSSVPLSGSTRGKVQIVTVHKSKGLEFDAVFIPFANWRLFPTSRDTMWTVADSCSGFEGFGSVPVGYSEAAAGSYFSKGYYSHGVFGVVDSVNMLYVALTRAKSQLYIGLGDKSQKDQKLTSKTVANVLDPHIPFDSPDAVEWTNGKQKVFRGEEVNKKGAGDGDTTHEISLKKYYGNTNIPALHIPPTSDDNSDMQ